MASNRIAGVCYLMIDGTQYPLRGKFEYSPLTTQKEGIAGQDGVHGYKETPCIPSLKCDFSDLGAISVSQLQNITASTITADMANGKVVVLTQAWVKGQISVNTEDGSYSIEFEGMGMNETVASS